MLHNNEPLRWFWTCFSNSIKTFKLWLMHENGIAIRIVSQYVTYREVTVLLQPSKWLANTWLAAVLVRYAIYRRCIVYAHVSPYYFVKTGKWPIDDFLYPPPPPPPHPPKIELDISRKVICMICQNLFSWGDYLHEILKLLSGKNKKKYFRISPAEIFSMIKR